LKYSIKNKFEFSPKNDKIDLQMSLIGDFNYANALAALTIAKSQGISEEIAKQAFKKVKFIPGRMEEIVEGQNFRIFVDLAHTPDSFEKVFEAIKQIPRNKIISVFGAAGGGRDKWKRPELGRIASENSDIVILCNEDSYSENPGQIISEIKSGIQNTRHKIQDTIFEIEDRREAIKKAFLLAQKDDIVLILGKGTEQTMVIGKNKFCWDDREVVREELKKIML